MTKQKKLKKLPKFKSEDEERDFWATHSVVDYFDMSHAVIMNFPNLRPSTQTISLRMPKWLLDNIKKKANMRDMPYQSFIKSILVDHVMEEQRKYKTNK